MGFLGVCLVCLGCDEPMLGNIRFTMFDWGFDTFLLGDEFFERCVWGCGFSGSCLLGDVDFGTSFAWGFAWGGFAWDFYWLKKRIRE